MARAVSAVAMYAVLLAVATIFGPWWALDVGGQVQVAGSSVHLQGTTGFGPFGIGVTAQGFVPGQASVALSTSFPYSLMPGVGSVIGLANLLVLLGAVAGSFAAVLAFLRRPSRIPGIAAGILSVVAFLFLLFAPLYVFWNFPQIAPAGVGPGGISVPLLSGWSGQFLQTVPIPSLATSIPLTIRWGGGWSWFLSFIAGGFFLVAAVLSFRAVLRPAAAPVAIAADEPADPASAAHAEPRGPAS